MRTKAISVLAALLLAPLSLGQSEIPPWIASSPGGMVASDSAAASEIGAEVLKNGGNAFDAAVATSFALAVARPYSTGLGGGGFMIAYVAKTKQFVALDFREVAPASAAPERYRALRDQHPDGPPPSIYGPAAVGVPGQVMGLWQIRENLGSKPWQALVAPAAKLARDGVEVDESFHGALKHIENTYKRWPTIAQKHPQLGAMFLKDGVAPDIGQRVANPKLAKTLETLAQGGPGAFYGGQIAEAIVKAADGAVSAQDLAKYQAAGRTPIRGSFKGYDIISMPPPSSGGVAIIEALNILEAKHAESPTPPDALTRVHLRIEAMKHAFADRARWLGDPDFASVPVKRLTSKEYAAELAKRISTTKAGAVDGYGVEQLPDDSGTSHFCVADKDGNIVAITETINGTFGSFVVAEPFGIILNNQMDDFLTIPGEPNMFGLVQSEANLVAPGKRPLSSMSPTLVFKDGRPVLALGASGGPRIISSVLNVLLNTVELNLPLHSALASIRAHHQWRPDEVFFDREPPEKPVSLLKALGHTISEHTQTGIVQAIRFMEDGTKVGGSDPRKGGRPAGAP